MTTSCGSPAKMSLLRDGDEPLWRDGVRHRLEHLLGDELDLEASGGRGGGDLGVPLERRRRGVQLEDQVGPELQGLRHRLWPFEEEQAGLLSRRTLGELGDGSDARGPRIVKHAPILGRGLRTDETARSPEGSGRSNTSEDERGASD
jgi:hypothetical protein